LIRVLALVTYSRNMGLGDIVNYYDLLNNTNWTSVVPGRITQEKWIIACGKK
jgi:hypothetical protein